MRVREAFVRRFGEDVVAKIESGAVEHDRSGVTRVALQTQCPWMEPFQVCLVVMAGSNCLTAWAPDHGIVVPASCMLSWYRTHGGIEGGLPPRTGRALEWFQSAAANMRWPLMALPRQNVAARRIAEEVYEVVRERWADVNRTTQENAGVDRTTQEIVEARRWVEEDFRRQPSGRRRG